MSWISPAGKAALIDYILCPIAWSGALSVDNCPSLADLHAAIDHRLICAHLRPPFAAAPRRGSRTVSVDALHTPAGLEAVTRAFKALPPVPWSTDSTTHVAIIHEHLHCVLADTLPPVPRPARHPAYTLETIGVVHQKRRARRRLRELGHSARQLTIRAVLAAFQKGTRFERADPPRAPPVAVSISSVRHQHMLVFVTHHRLSSQLTVLMNRDKAQFLRAEMQQARDMGSAHFSFRVRPILRIGRKFKVPALLPTLPDGRGGEAAGQPAVLHLLGQHYAEAERASEMTTTACLAERAASPTVSLTEALLATDVPSLPALARAMAGIAYRKAGGVSRLPPDIYRMVPELAAAAIYPVLCKTLLQGVLPLQWAGGKAHAIPKTASGLDQLSAWRSIMLLEPEAKAVQKSFRPALAALAQTQACEGQHGGFSRQTLAMVSARAKAHYLFLQQHSLCGGGGFHRQSCRILLCC